MAKTEDQIEELLGYMDDPSIVRDLPIPVQGMSHDVVQVFRLMQKQIKELQQIPKNFKIGVYIIVSIGGGGATLIAAIAGFLQIMGYFKS